MDWQKFERIQNLFFEYGIKPIIAVIPDNQDEKIKINPPDSAFWQKIKELGNRGWIIAMHGYQHKYAQENGGILKIHAKSEFAGLPHQEQYDKIKKGKEILENHGIKTDIFIAPGHSFDKNTLKALKENGFNAISDGIALYPFKKYDIIWVPQIAWLPPAQNFANTSRKTADIMQKIAEITRNSAKYLRNSAKFREISAFFRVSPIITFCLHPNTMQENDFKNLENFVKNNAIAITDFIYAINYSNNHSFLKKIYVFVVNFLFKKIWYLRFHIKI